MTKMIEVSYKPVLIQSSNIMEASSGVHLQRLLSMALPRAHKRAEELYGCRLASSLNQRFDVLLGIWTKPLPNRLRHRI